MAESHFSQSRRDEMQRDIAEAFVDILGDDDSSLQRADIEIKPAYLMRVYVVVIEIPRGKLGRRRPNDRHRHEQQTDRSRRRAGAAGRGARTRRADEQCPILPSLYAPAGPRTLHPVLQPTGRTPLSKSVQYQRICKQYQAVQCPFWITTTAPKNGLHPLSHQFDSPIGREDPRLNLCNFYLFAGNTAETTAMAMTVNASAHAHTRERFAARSAPRRSRADGPDGDLVAFGQTGQVMSGDDGVRAYAGVVKDAFAGDAAALEAFKTAFAQRDYRPEAFRNQVNFFIGRTIAAIVLKVPNRLITSNTPVDAWATVPLYDHDSRAAGGPSGSAVAHPHLSRRR